MSAMPTSIPPANSRAISTPQAGRNWQQIILDSSSVLAGPPTLIALIATFFTDNTRTLAICTGVGVLIAFGLMLFPRFLKKTPLLVVLPWVLTGVLVIVLVLVVTPNRVREQSKLLANSWLEWQKELERSAAQCKKKGDAKCLAGTISPVLEKRPRPTIASDITGLASDVIAGQLLLANDNIRSVLNSRFGVGDRFIGSGFSEPVGNTDYTAARTSEYFAPNLSDSAPHVWNWQLEPRKLIDGKPVIEHTLIDILLETPPLNHADFVDNWNWISKDHLGPNDPHPALVRYALLNLKNMNKSGCLGRPEASRVFMNRLGEVVNKTVAGAAAASGYTVAPNADEPTVRLFVWVYAPTEGGIIFPATWKTVFAKFGEWAIAETCRPAN